LLCALAAAAGLLGAWLPPTQRAAAAPAGDDTVIGFVVRGVGNGHGRGMSQWGAFGRALAGHSWQNILDAYYGGTVLGDVTPTNVRVRLTSWDNVATLGVISRLGAARWSSANSGSTNDYPSLYATEVAPNVFDVFGSSTHGCPGATTVVVPMVDMAPGSEGPDVIKLQQLLAHFGHDPGPFDGIFGDMTATAVRAFQAESGLAQTGEWHSPEWTTAQARLNQEGQTSWNQLADDVSGPVVFTTTADQSASAPGEVLGACRASGAVQHYRGSIELHSSADGNRVVNSVSVENYLRGVVPKEVSASWGDAGGGQGINSLRAQAVAARSYGLTQSRYTYAGTCDTPSCQVYGGAATRGSAGTGNYVRVEHANTDQAILDTAGKVRKWSHDGTLVSTEFSASNGPRTAGGSFPPVDDPFDDVPDNPLHRWTRVVDADAIAAAYGLSRADTVHTAHDAGSPYDGVWANEVVLGDGATRSAWDFRNDFGLPAPGFELVPIRRDTTSVLSFAFIGDSVGVGVAGEATSPLRTVIEGVHASQMFDSRGGRTTLEGAQVAATVPEGTDLVVVELGYNDSPATMPARIDSLMQALRNRRVGQVLWVTVSERRESTDYDMTNDAIRGATARWPELSVIDWNAASAGVSADRWYSDDVHLTGTGNAEFALWLREQILDATAQPVDAGQLYRVPVLGLGGVPAGATAGAAGVGGAALNVTAVGPSGPGYLRLWDCAAPEPDTSSVNWTASGAIAPNAVLVPLAADGTGEVCLRPLVRTHVIVDVAGYFPAASGVGVLHGAAGRAADTRTSGRVGAGQMIRVPLLGVAGIPSGADSNGAGVTGAALNVTAVNPAAAGYLRVWDCAGPEPDTSSVNFTTAGAVEPNAVVVPLTGPGEVCVRSLVQTDVIVDVAGWFSGGVRPAAGRARDTRGEGRMSANAVLRVPVYGRAGVPTGAAGVALNVTAVNPVGPGYLRVWDCNAPEPDTSSVNFLTAGSVEPNAVIVPLTGSGEVCVRTLVETDVLVDIAGWFDAGVASAGGRIADTRYGIGPTPS
jgi:lysophospholipase L1-like esterase